MNDLIEKLSSLRSQFNCFDENEREAYHTLSEAIKVLSERPEPCEDTVSRQKAIDAVSDGIIREQESFVECVEECNAMIEWAVETLKKMPSSQPEPCEDDKHCSNCIYSGRPIYKSPCSECHDNSKWEMTSFSRSYENDVEREDAVSRRILLNDLKELITAWEKYPVMAEQIKGVETAIKYVELIPSVMPKRCRLCGKKVESNGR